MNNVRDEHNMKNFPPTVSFLSVRIKNDQKYKYTREAEYALPMFWGIHRFSTWALILPHKLHNENQDADEYKTRILLSS